MKSTPRVKPGASPAAPPPAATTAEFLDPIPGILLHGTLNFLAGASGSGKSRMLASWWQRWITGRKICGHKTNRPAGLYWLFADRSWSEDGAIIFRAHGLTEADVPHYNLSEDTGITENMKRPEEAMKLLTRGIDAMNPVPGSLVIVDPLSPLFIKGSPNDPRAVAWSLFACRQLCQKRQITMIATAYYSKQKGGTEDKYTRAIDRLSGSGVFAGYGQTVMYIEEPTAERLYYLFGWRPRHAPEQEFNFEMDDRGLFRPYQGLQPESLNPDHDRPHQLLLLIPDDGVDTGDLATAAMERFDISRATFFRDLKTLKDRQLVEQSEHGRITRRKPS